MAIAVGPWLGSASQKAPLASPSTTRKAHPATARREGRAWALEVAGRAAVESGPFSVLMAVSRSVAGSGLGVVESGG